MNDGKAGKQEAKKGTTVAATDPQDEDSDSETLKDFNKPRNNKHKETEVFQIFRFNL